MLGNSAARNGDKRINYAECIQMELSPGEYLYMRYFNAENNQGTDFSIDHFEDGTLQSRLVAEEAHYEDDHQWELHSVHRVALQSPISL